MATFRSRRNGDGSTSWDVQVRRVGYPSLTRSFRTRLEAELWASQPEAAAKGGGLVASSVTVRELIDYARPRPKSPYPAALDYWQEYLGELPSAT